MADEGADQGEIVKGERTQVKEEEQRTESGDEDEESDEDDDDDDDDCYEIDPTDFTRKLSFHGSNSNSHGDGDDEVTLVAEKGPVALRDFPHPRHLCANFPFESSSHESYCSKCFCYVCEIAAPCSQWTGKSRHCDVSKKPSENQAVHAENTIIWNESENVLHVVV